MWVCMCGIGRPLMASLQVAEAYKAVCEQIDEPSMKTYLPACWMALIKVCYY